MSDLTTLTDDDKRTILVAAHGVVSLMAAADPGAISSTRAGMAGGKAMSSATGLVGRVLAGKLDRAGTKVLKGDSVAEIADSVFAALTASVGLLAQKSPDEAANFKRTVDTIIASAGQAHHGEPSPAQSDMATKIRAALDAA